MDRTLEGLVRLIDKRKAGDRGTTESMVEWSVSSGVTGAAGEGPTCTLDGDDSADVLEPYGFACSAPSGEALVLAPGGDVDNLVALVSSVPGRPATDTGDVAIWTVGGHEIYLDDDGGIVVTARSLSDVTILVDDGQVVNVGDALAAALLKAQLAQNHLVQAAAYAIQLGNFAPNDGGVLAFTNFAAFLNGTAIIPPAIPGNDLVNAAATTKAKGT
jgi:hypothetical protein